MTSRDMALARYTAFLESLTPSSLDQLTDFVTLDVRFKDPFHDVRGPKAMGSVLEAAFDTVQDMRFRVADQAEAGQVGFFAWTLTGQLRGKTWTVSGITQVRFTMDGKVSQHLEHWDAAGQLYEGLPVIGPLLRWLRRRIAAPSRRGPHQSG